MFGDVSNIYIYHLSLHISLCCLFHASRVLERYYGVGIFQLGILSFELGKYAKPKFDAKYGFFRSSLSSFSVRKTPPLCKVRYSLALENQRVKFSLHPHHHLTPPGGPSSFAQPFALIDTSILSQIVSTHSLSRHLPCVPWWLFHLSTATVVHPSV